jgi:hypothetical protein
MDMNPLRRKRERDVARDLRREFMKNVTTETGAAPELLAHHFGLVCRKFNFVPDEASAKRILQRVSADIAMKRRRADRLLQSLGD